MAGAPIVSAAAAAATVAALSEVDAKKAPVVYYYWWVEIQLKHSYKGTSRCMNKRIKSVNRDDYASKRVRGLMIYNIEDRIGREVSTEWYVESAIYGPLFESTNPDID